MEQTLLVELRTEELPPKALPRLGEVFKDAVFNGLQHRNLTDCVSQNAVWFATPRRLAVLVKEVVAEAPDRTEKVNIMPVSVALDAEGKPTAPLLKKLDSMGIPQSAIAQFQRQAGGKSEVLVYDMPIKGARLDDVLADIVAEALKKLPVPKLMRWGDNEHQFVRPVHGLVMMHGSRVVPGEVLGLKSGNVTRGHRFLHEDEFQILSADGYEEGMLAHGKVIPSFAERKSKISELLETKAKELNATINPSAGLLDEVTALVEWPVVYVGEFEAEFLEVPQECLILTMQQHQKYFPLLGADGKLLNKFLIVSNMEVSDPSHIIDGNQRVVRPRLADARFFYNQDRKQTLESRVLGLAKVVYHNKLYTLGERVHIVSAIAKAIGQQLGGDLLAQTAERAALLAKTDLLTDMVGEFPELQGTMGRYYALHDGLPAETADAIEDHYKPRFAGDDLPRNAVGICVALADKLETLVGMFSIGEKPTGDKDPFALRRHALGIIRMLIERNIDLGLDSALEIAVESLEDERIQIDWSKKVFEMESARAKERSQVGGIHSISVGYSSRQIGAEIKQSISNFIYERLAGMLREQDYSAQEVDAVISLKPQYLGDIPKRLAAVRAFSELPEAAALAAANKRVGNILKKSEAVPNGEILGDLLHEPAEKEFLKALQDTAKKANAAFDAGDYTAHLLCLAVLKEPVDRFFDQVMVNIDDADLRTNRLRLLAALHASMNRVADLSRLAV